jgi:hypothetical protein
VVSLLLGCSSGDSQPPAQASGAAETSETAAAAPQAAPAVKRAAPVACELVSPDEISERIGRPVQGTLPTEDPLYCIWSTRATPGIAGDVRVSVDVNPIDAQGAIDRMIERGATRVPGLGVDAAIELRRNPDFYKVMIHRGDMAVEVVVFGDPGSLQPEQVIGLARLVNERL